MKASNCFYNPENFHFILNLFLFKLCFPNPGPYIRHTYIIKYRIRKGGGRHGLYRAVFNSNIEQKKCVSMIVPSGNDI